MKVKIAALAIFLVAVATVIQMLVDWYQSYAYGIPMPGRVKAMVIVAGLLSLAAAALSLASKR